MPVALVDVLRIALLLMVVGLISDIDDLIEKS